MAHFAEIDENFVVLRVIVAEQEFIDTGLLGNTEKWIKTSYNSKGGIHFLSDNKTPSGKQALRKNYAGPGFYYDKNRDAFIPPKPFNSWILNENSCLWESPIPYPTDDCLYEWSEKNINWIKKT